jgi:hypothetical protein
MQKQDDISLARIIAKWLREHNIDAVLEEHHRGYDSGREPTVHVLLADKPGEDEWPRVELEIRDGTTIQASPRFYEIGPNRTKNPWDHRKEVNVTHPESFHQLVVIIEQFKEEYENDAAAAG